MQLPCTLAMDMDAMGMFVGTQASDDLAIASGWHSGHNTIGDECKWKIHVGIVELDAGTWVHLNLEGLARVWKDSYIEVDVSKCLRNSFVASE